jgi:Inorganic pyrophosphatase
VTAQPDLISRGGVCLGERGRPKALCRGNEQAQPGRARQAVVGTMRTFEGAASRPGLSICLQGDNDPVDVVEIGSATLEMGGVYKVKALGVYAMIDDGELDWKVIAINVDDPKAPLVNDVEDVERCSPPPPARQHGR